MFIMNTYQLLSCRRGCCAITVQAAREFDIILHSVTFSFSPGGRLSRVVLGLGNTARDFIGKCSGEKNIPIDDIAAI
jgi:hypothetical protein